MALTPTEQAAAERLTEYNGGRYDASTNQHGLAGEGYKTNIPAALNDTGAVAEAVGRIAGEVDAAAAVVAPAIPIVTAARDQAVAAAQAAAGIVQHVQPSEIAGIDPVLDFAFRAATAVPSGVITGSSGKWVTNQAGLLVNVPAGTAPIDYDPITSVVRGLLVEESRTNLLTYSQQFDNAAWTKSEATVSSNVTSSPDGSATADKFIESASNATHYVTQSATASASSVCCFSFYAKAAERSVVLVHVPDGTATGNRLEARFDLSSGTATSVVNVGNASGATALISSIGGGWYRCSLRGTPNTTGATVRPTIFLVAGASSYTGDGASGVYLWGAQLEAGSFATSPIVTTSSTVTRAADVNTLLLSGIPGWNASEGTIYVEFIPAVRNLGYQRLVRLDDGTNNNVIELITYPGQAGAYGYGANGGSAIFNFSSAPSPDVLLARQKLAVAWKAGDFAQVVNGGAAVAASSGAVPSLSTLRIGSAISGGQPNGYFPRITLFPRRIANATLQLLTA